MATKLSLPAAKKAARSGPLSISKRVVRTPEPPPPHPPRTAAALAKAQRELEQLAAAAPEPEPATDPAPDPAPESEVSAAKKRGTKPVGGKDLRWRDFEWEAVISAAAVAMLEQPSLSRSDALMLAQGVLGEDRHKTPNNFRPSAIPTRWAQELEKLKDRYEAAKTSKMRDDEQRIAQLEQERQELADNLAKAQAMLAAAEENARAAQKPHDAPPQSLQAPIAAAPTPTPTYGFALLQQGVSMILADILAGAIRSPQVRDAVASLVTVQAPSEPPHEPRPEAPPPVKAAVTLGYSTPKATKPARVLVVGLLGSQAETIRREFGDKLDLRFLTQEDSSERIKENSKSVDKVYALVGKMGHHIEKAIMQGGGRDKYVRINGTVSELARALTGFVNSGAPAPMH